MFLRKHYCMYTPICCMYVFFEETLRRPEPEHSSSYEQPQEKLVEKPKTREGPCRLKKNYDCPTCGKVFSHNTALQRHLVIHSGKRPYKCFICGRGFTQSGNLKTHMKVHRGQWQQEAPMSLIRSLLKALVMCFSVKSSLLVIILLTCCFIVFF